MAMDPSAFMVESHEIKSYLAAKCFYKLEGRKRFELLNTLYVL